MLMQFQNPLLTSRFLFSILLFHFLLFTCVPAQSQTHEGSTPRAGESINFEEGKDNDGSIYIPAQIGGDTYYFMLDTGFSEDVTLKKWVADKLHLPVVSSVGFLNNKFSTVHIARLPLFREPLSGYEFKNQSVPVLDLNERPFADPNRRLAGVIGIGALRKLAMSRLGIQIDYPSKTIRRVDTSSLQVPEKEAVSVPLLKNGELSVLYVKIQLPDGSFQTLLLDTGSDSTIISMPSLPSENMPIAGRSQISFINYSKIFTFHVLLKTIGLGELSEPNVTAKVSASPNPFVLGTKLLSRFRVTLDLQNNRMILERATDYKQQSRKPGIFPIVFRYLYGKYYISLVMDKYRQQFHAGDELFLCNGYKLRGRTPQQWGDVVGDYEGDVCDLILRRKDGSQYSVKIQLEPLTNIIKLPLDGVIFQRQTQSTLVVVEMIRGCYAEQKGLRVGDRIVEINGYGVKQQADSTIQSLLNKYTRLYLKVERDNSQKPLFLTL